MVAEIVRVELTEAPAVSTTLVVLNDALILVEETFVARVTVPLKRAKLVRVIVEVSLDGTFRMREGGSAEILKSTTLTVTITERERKPLVPVTFTVYVPKIEELRVKVDVAKVPKVTFVGLSDAVRPGGNTVAESNTTPVKPPALVTLIFEVADEPA